MAIERRLGSDMLNKLDWVAGTSTGAVLALALVKGNIENLMNVIEH